MNRPDASFGFEDCWSSSHNKEYDLPWPSRRFKRRRNCSVDRVLFGRKRADVIGYYLGINYLPNRISASLYPSKALRNSSSSKGTRAERLPRYDIIGGREELRQVKSSCDTRKARTVFLSVLSATAGIRGVREVDDCVVRMRRNE